MRRHTKVTAARAAAQHKRTRDVLARAAGSVEMKDRLIHWTIFVGIVTGYILESYFQKHYAQLVSFATTLLWFLKG